MDRVPQRCFEIAECCTKAEHGSKPHRAWAASDFPADRECPAAHGRVPAEASGSSRRWIENHHPKRCREMETESRPPVISVFHLWTFWVRCQLETRKWFALLWCASARIQEVATATRRWDGASSTEGPGGFGIWQDLCLHVLWREAARASGRIWFEEVCRGKSGPRRPYHRAFRLVPCVSCAGRFVLILRDHFERKADPVGPDG